MNGLAHGLYSAGILLGIVGGLLGGILIDQKYIGKPLPEVVTVVKQIPRPASLEIDCKSAVQLCRQTFRDRMRSGEVR